MIEDVVYLKLITGDDIVAMVESSNEEYLHVVEPIVIYNLNTQRGSILRATKWIPYLNTDSFSVRHSHIVIIERPSEYIEEYYFDVIESLNKQKEEFNEREFTEEEIEAYYEKNMNKDTKVH